MRIGPEELQQQAGLLLAEGMRVALIAGNDDGDALRAVYVFTAPGRIHELEVPLDRARPQLPSLAGLSFAAGRFEREMHDLYGIVPVGHPLPRRLVRHFHWPTGWHPMLMDAGERPEFGPVDGPYPFRAVEGTGVFEIPVGPVHAGMIEPGHFRFSVVGETILNLKARLWFVHKGIEKLFRGRRPDQAIELAERISGDTAVGHTLAFSLAIEDALGIRAPVDAQRIRAMLLELERIYNHVTDIGALCNDAGHGILNAHAQRIREQLLRMNETVSGHRLLRGGVRPGWAEIRRWPDTPQLRSIAADIEEIVDLALGHSVVRDRFAGTAVLTRQQAAELGTLGYVARASGLSIDARHDHPSVDAIPACPRTSAGGDVLARFLIRAEEIQDSVRLIEELSAGSEGRSAAGIPARGTGGSGLGMVEGWRGTIVHRVELTAAGTICRIKIVDPSFLNWPALPVALADTIVPDFPLTNKSFNLSYAGNDL